jgi:hypothetical protein
VRVSDPVAQLVERASSPGFEGWWARLSGVGYCASPVHLAGQRPDGSAAQVMGRCKNRRASVCPSCSRLYAGDTWQLVHAGLAGGHGVPDSISANPAVFVTLTAPGFGAVHSTGAPCRSARRVRCVHGRPSWCAHAHASSDLIVGQPICTDCYDYPGQVLFTWHAPELWRRFTIALRRGLGHHLRAHGHQPDAARVSFVKIIELQRRGAPHFHAVLRLDSDEDAETSTAELASLAGDAASSVSLDVAGLGGETVTLKFGSQIDVQPLTASETTRPRRKVAGYLAKYVTKSVGDFGLSPRRMSAAAIDRLDVTDHVRRLLHTIARLSHERGRGDMARWLHTLGYRGHTTTKSRHYSVTMTALRAKRAAWRSDATPKPPTTWTFVDIGLNDGERLLALSAEARAREARWAARDVLASASAWPP